MRKSCLASLSVMLTPYPPIYLSYDYAAMYSIIRTVIQISHAIYGRNCHSCAEDFIEYYLWGIVVPSIIASNVDLSISTMTMPRCIIIRVFELLSHVEGGLSPNVKQLLLKFGSLKRMMALAFPGSSRHQDKVGFSRRQPAYVWGKPNAFPVANAHCQYVSGCRILQLDGEQGENPWSFFCAHDRISSKAILQQLHVACLSPAVSPQN